MTSDCTVYFVPLQPIFYMSEVQSDRCQFCRWCQYDGSITPKPV